MAALLCMNGAFIIRIFSWTFTKENYTNIDDFCKSYFYYLYEHNTKAQKNFDKKTSTKKFDLKKFRKSSIRKVYDSLHGISHKAIPLANAVEIMAYCLVDGKVDQDSAFETNLYNHLVKTLKEMKAWFPILKI